MKSVNEMNDFEKTMVIIGLMPNWIIWGNGGNGDDIILRIGGQWRICLQKPFYLYDQMWLWAVWRVLNWADGDLGGTANRIKFTNWFYSCGHDAPVWPAVSPGEFIRLCLDKVLQLAEEAGLLK